ncbi:MAG: PIF1 helicase [Parcubacteria group bacterium GW2011_GWC2_38_7]|nr:MAG: PIF1 helicase [Parcubacteria group bacterium GW2011_GWC2_38_7]
MHIFSLKAQKAIDLILNSDENVFVTGKAGTGKSTLLEHIRLTAERRIIVLAPTGISAVNVNGETIHSFFTLKPGFEKDEAMHMVMNQKKQDKFRRLKTIAIDEISMVRADLLDAIDIVLKRARKNEKPFGGVQMVFFGDLYQLPPVITHSDSQKFFSEYDSPYFFDATIFRGQSNMFSEGFKLKLIELDEIYRQKDLDFIQLLNAVRDNSITFDQIKKLNARHQPNFVPSDDQKYIHLMTTNASANEINDKKLKQLKEDEKIFVAERSGTVARNLFPNDEAVSLRVGAQIMFICNDAERRWVNGTIGKILDIFDRTNPENGCLEAVVKIEKADGRIVEVRKHTWEISKYVYVGGEFVRKNLGTFKQIPIKLAWAITIHKSQGKTFDKVVIDLGHGSFAHGQTYVALSRCSSFDGLVLKRALRKSDIIMDQRVHGFACSNLEV